ncbi:MAG: SPOR domain-containing protein [Cyclobacteriaceae bacterium]
MNRYYLFGAIAVLTLVEACTPAATVTTATTSYSEDLSVHREKYPDPDYSALESTGDQSMPELKEINATHHIKNELDSVLRKIEKANEKINYISGLTIQLYSGSDLKLANEIKKKIYSISDDYSPEVYYDQPNYKVSVGEYFDRLEANQDFNMLKKEFTRALLVPKRIPIESKN